MNPRIFGLDAQTLFDTSIMLVAMLFLFILLSYLLFNPARKMMQKRRELIQGQLEEAASAKKDALAMKEEYDSKLAGVEDESAALLAEARKKAKSREAEIVPGAKGRDGMKQEIVQAATLMAGKFVEKSMDEAIQAELIDETLKEMGDDTWQN